MATPAELPDEPGGLEALLAALADDDPELRVDAARALGDGGHVGAPVAITPLLALANDASRDTWTRRVAVRSLEQLFSHWPADLDGIGDFGGWGNGGGGGDGGSP